MFEKLAEEMRTARTNAGLTQAELAAAIRMDPGFLQRMETGDFSFLPEIYVKAFIKDYAKAVSLDPELLMKQYQNIKTGKGPSDYGTAGYGEDTDSAFSQKPHGPDKPVQPRVFSDGFSDDDEQEKSRLQLTPEQKTYLAAGVVLVIVAAFLIYYFIIRESSPDIITEQPPVEEVIAEQRRYEEPEPAALPAKPDTISLRIFVKDSCWVAITTDSVTSSRRYPPGRTIAQKSASNIKLSLGNASKVEMYLNDQPFDLSPFKYHTVRFSISRDSVQELK